MLIIAYQPSAAEAHIAFGAFHVKLEAPLIMQPIIVIYLDNLVDAF